MDPRPLVWLAPADFVALSHWTWRWPVVLVLGVAIASYTIGWVRIRLRSHAAPAVRSLLAFLAGWALLVTGLLSPMDELGGAFFSWHMAQHLCILYAAPLLLAGRPLPQVLWSFPRPVRKWVASWFGPGGWPRRLLEALTRPLPAFVAGLLSLWVWHYPPLYDAVLTRRWLHDWEHLTFFGGALLFWWPLIEAPPVRRALRSDAQRAFYLVAWGLHSSVLGALVTFWPAVLYHRYLVGAGVAQDRLLADQAFGGLLMWLSGGIIAALVGLARLGAVSWATEDSVVVQ